jgi:O-succinylbenzoic acid--CoA ligase
MTARPGTRREFAVVDADDVPAVRHALAAALEGSGRPLLPVRAADRDRLLAILDAATSASAGTDSAGDPGALVIPTSGSTGVPKLVVLTAAALVASARATHRRLGGDGQWLLSLPTSGIAGLQVLTRSLLGGREPVTVSPSAGLRQIAGAIGGMAGRRYAALVPTQLHRLLAVPGGAETLAAFDAVLLGGAAAPAALLAAARGGGVRVVTTYGMTETAGGCVYDGRPLDGVTAQVAADGRVRIGGATLFSGYLGRPADTRRALSHGWFTTADRGEIDDDGLLRVVGRLDDVVISGGVNVALPAVADRLRDHPDLADAAVVGVPDDEWGTAVVAFVVVDPSGRVDSGDDTDADEWRAWVATALGRAHAPRRVVALTALPMLDNGKVDRQALMRRAEGVLSEGSDGSSRRG